MVAEVIEDVGRSDLIRRGRKTTHLIPLQEGRGDLIPLNKRVNTSIFRSPSGTSFVTWKHERNLV